MRNPLPPGFTAAIPLGEGGQARTWLCWQESPGRWVVVKTDPQERGELQAEAELLERLPGAPVPALLAKDLDSVHPWIAISWIDGVRLDALPSDLDDKERLAIIAAAARSVAVLHGRGVVHGDLSPSNLIALPNGEVLLVDLGMASIGGARTGGTWETFPPERIQGKPASPASDVFALGVLALRLLERLPSRFAESRAEWNHAILGDELPALARDIPQLARALGASPAERPSALELAQGLATSEPCWPRERLRRKALACFDDLLEMAILHHAHHKHWSDAWRLQRERIERAVDPEPLLPELGRFARERDRGARRATPWIAAAFVLLIAAILVAFHLSRPDPLPRKSIRSAPSSSDMVLWPSSPTESFPLPSIPPGASLRVDGLPTDMPDDGFLLLTSGRHHIELRDAVGLSILDTFWSAASSRSRLRTIHRESTHLRHAPLPETAK